MSLPVLQPKAQKNISTPKKRKIGVDAEVVEIIERCRQKNRKIQKHLKHTTETCSFELDSDINKQLKSLGKKYEKNLDNIITQLGIVDQSNPIENSIPPATPPEEESSLSKFLSHSH